MTSIPLEPYLGRIPAHEGVEGVHQGVPVTSDAFDDVESFLALHDRITLRLHGDISGATIPELELLIESLLALQPESLIIDLNGTNSVTEQVFDRLLDQAATAGVAVTAIGMGETHTPGPWAGTSSR